MERQTITMTEKDQQRARSPITETLSPGVGRVRSSVDPVGAGGRSTGLEISPNSTSMPMLTVKITRVVLRGNRRGRRGSVWLLCRREDAGRLKVRGALGVVVRLAAAVIAGLLSVVRGVSSAERPAASAE